MESVREKIEESIATLERMDYNNSHMLEEIEGEEYIKYYDLEDILNALDRYFAEFDREAEITLQSADCVKRITIKREAWFDCEEDDYFTFVYNITVTPEEYEVKVFEEV